MNLRWLKRNGEKVLQQEQLTRCGYTSEHKWVDVPIMQEPKKAREWLIGYDKNGKDVITQISGEEKLYCCESIKVREVLEPEAE